MTAKQLIQRNLEQYQRLEAKKRSYADSTNDLTYRAECLAEAAVYSIAADDMREILETAEDIKPKRDYKSFTRICVDCGKVMHNVANTRKRCPDCIKKHDNEVSKRYYHEHYSATGDRSEKLRTRAKTAQERDAELVAENARLEAIGGSYGKGRLKEYLTAQNKKPAGAPTPTSCKG